VSQTPLRFTLPLPISKNRRVRLGRKEVLSVARDGTVAYSHKTVAINSKEWEAYKKLVFQIVQWELRLTIAHPSEDERVVFECEWHLKSDRSDCVNFHDLLADALKVAFEIDDRWFLIRDVWSQVCQDGRPRVEIAAWKAGHPDLPGRGGSGATVGLP
jgi:hypothetical protein